MAGDNMDDVTNQTGLRVGEILQRSGKEGPLLAKLVVLQGAGAGRSVVVRDEVIIGRDSSCNMPLVHGDVSRKHARVFRTGPKEFSVEDLGSSNGTAVNNQLLEGKPKTLVFGDRIRIGETTLLLFSNFDPEEERMLQAQRLQSLGQLASGVAHDVNNLVGAALANLDILRDLPNLTVDAAACITDSQAALTRVVEMVRQLLDFSRRGKVESRPVELEQLVRQGLRLMQHKRPQPVEVTITIPGHLAVLGDSTQLLQVITNLCANAADAMPHGGRLDWTASALEVGEDGPPMAAPNLQPGHFVHITVRDTGSGMSPDVMNRVFEPFYTTKPVGQGTGMGLATVFGIVHNHGGHIGVASTVGQGTCFNIFLPMALPPGTAASTQPGFSTDAVTTDAWGLATSKVGRFVPAGQARPVILAVDDEPVLLRSTQRLLARMTQYDVMTAPNGAQALDIYARMKDVIAVVLLDINMPGQNGLEVCAAMRGMNPNARVVLTSGAELPDPSVLQQPGISFLPKPYNEDALRAAVAAAVLV